MLLLILCNILILMVLPELQRTGPSLWATLFPLAIVTCVATFGIMPFVVRTLFTASYNGFHLQLLRNVQPDREDYTTPCKPSQVTNQH